MSGLPKKEWERELRFCLPLHPKTQALDSLSQAQTLELGRSPTQSSRTWDFSSRGHTEPFKIAVSLLWDEDNNACPTRQLRGVRKYVSILCVQSTPYSSSEEKSKLSPWVTKILSPEKGRKTSGNGPTQGLQISGFKKEGSMGKGQGSLISPTSSYFYSSVEHNVTGRVGRCWQCTCWVGRESCWRGSLFINFRGRTGDWTLSSAYPLEEVWWGHQPGNHSGWKLWLRSEMGWSEEEAVKKEASLSAWFVMRVIPHTSKTLPSMTVSEQ